MPIPDQKHFPNESSPKFEYDGKNEVANLPLDLAGFQQLEDFVTLEVGDLAVQNGKPIFWVNGLAGESVGGYPMTNFYRRIPVPRQSGVTLPSDQDSKFPKPGFTMPMSPITQPSDPVSTGIESPLVDDSTKLSNPKDLIGSSKVPLHLFPSSATTLGALALLDGALKYGRGNWRAVGVRSSIYYDAAQRHLMKWFEGEDTDPDSGLPHLAHALACVAILIDAGAAGKLTDDRAFPANFPEFLKELTPHVERLKAKHAERDPKHYTIADAR